MKSFPEKVFVTGIGTGVGKTIASAVLCKALSADYWKPIQTGISETSDTVFTKSLVTNNNSVFHNEAYRLKEPASPHYAAQLENIEIDLNSIVLPETNNRLVIEGAGGILVPLNKELVMFDLIEYFELPVIVVVRNYLGSINHTLLTSEFLEAKGVNVLGLIFSGANYNDNEEVIQHFSGLPTIGRIDECSEIDKDFISAQAEKMRLQLSLHYKI
jgi:dethiobiotin synthetase